MQERHHICKTGRAKEKKVTKSANQRGSPKGEFISLSFLNMVGNANSVKVFSGRILHEMHYAGCILGSRVGLHLN